MRMLKNPAPVVCLVLAFPATAQTLQEDIERAVRSELEYSGVPSLQAAVGYRGEILFESAYGLADIENGVSASSETRYRSASISKWLTATAAMILAEQGQLDLDEPIQAYCPSFPKKRWPVSLGRRDFTHDARTLAKSGRN